MNQTSKKRGLGAPIVGIILASALIAGGCATTPGGSQEAAGPPPHLDPSRPLQVSVESPITHPWIWTNQVAESFYSWMVKGFREAGYKGAMVYVFPGNNTAKGTQKLEIRIDTWRLNHDHSVEATVTAVYDSGDGVRHSIGIARGESMQAFAMQDRLSLERAYDESARNVAKDLLREIAPINQ